jgi:hypothetical protein
MRIVLVAERVDGHGERAVVTVRRGKWLADEHHAGPAPRDRDPDVAPTAPEVDRHPVGLPVAGLEIGYVGYRRSVEDRHTRRGRHEPAVSAEEQDAVPHLGSGDVGRVESAFRRSGRDRGIGHRPDPVPRPARITVAVPMAWLRPACKVEA